MTENKRLHDGEPFDVMPAPFVGNRPPIAVGIMAQEGDPVLDMAYSLRNIEYLLGNILDAMRVTALKDGEHGSNEQGEGSKNRTGARAKTD